MGFSTKFSGIIPPVSSIFAANGALDEAGMRRVIDYLIAAGVDGLFFLGTGGEFSQMSATERMSLTETVIRLADGRVPVLIGVGSTNTREAVGLSRHAQLSGADAVVAINPYYWQITEDNLFGYYGAIAQAVTLPVILYNFPKLTGQDLYPELVKRLADAHANIVGIKDTIDSVAHLRDMIATVKPAHPDFSVFCGFDDHLLNTLLLGGDGAISASANFAPALSVDLYRSVCDGDLAQAVALHKTILQLPRLYQIDSPFVNVVKEAMRLTGLDISTVCLPPTQPLNEKQKAQVRQTLIDANILPQE
ncbi:MULTISPECIES: dihydrodipicolinate synthase family protein [Brenneria]|uniref:Dihydrodipicolinate synthase family protein n=1 Tax=Brenneria nigrifluens DSM 30175 = ATCC 13028 TaxID=1121120 RepID=A0A2U1UVM8_9GAMM|nr:MULTISPECIES: dihydrodipicolinate synthase family protein [Brenneria]EHD20186.1 Dihydrodipicolinate synthase [Brenneria sp. EniD312]PWC25723.1 dihydrodipicolinate synthase family protein [Brenneria nigrifluens DSM 30175 = ATCC 13028]QCR03412.1 dihydrodipicolinate synthase family protein [Brenneria nigrifluens DSM 30175 = ATCC 13028]